MNSTKAIGALAMITIPLIGVFLVLLGVSAQHTTKHQTADKLQQQALSLANQREGIAVDTATAVLSVVPMQQHAVNLKATPADGGFNLKDKDKFVKAQISFSRSVDGLLKAVDSDSQLSKNKKVASLAEQLRKAELSSQQKWTEYNSAAVSYNDFTNHAAVKLFGWAIGVTHYTVFKE